MGTLMRQLKFKLDSIEHFQRVIDASYCDLQGTPASVFTALTQWRAESYKTILNLSDSVDPNELLRQLNCIEQQLSYLKSTLECCVAIDLLRQYLPMLIKRTESYNLKDYDSFNAKFTEYNNEYAACVNCSSDSEISTIHRLRRLFYCLAESTLSIIRMDYYRSVEKWYRDNTLLIDKQSVITAYKSMLAMLTVPSDLLQLLPVFEKKLWQLDQFLKKSDIGFVGTARHRLLAPILPKNKSSTNNLPINYQSN